MDSTLDEPKLKSPKTAKEQVEILKSRGMIIEDEEFAMNMLRLVNYYRLRAYWISLQNRATDQFAPGTTFNQVFYLYEFDRKLRKLTAGLLELIEISFRTGIAYLMSNLHGQLFYLDESYFEDKLVHEKFITVMNKSIEDARNGNELFVIHHDAKYDHKLPVWAAVELMTFTTLSRFYTNLKPDYRRDIALSCFGIPPLYLQSWIKSLSHIRNICAHYGRIYNKSLKSHSIMLFPKDKSDIRNGTFFATLYVSGILCPQAEERTSFRDDLERLVAQYQGFIELKRIGFSQEWKEILSDRVAHRRFDIDNQRIQYLSASTTQ